MKGFRSSKRSPGARPMKSARPTNTDRPLNGERSLSGMRALRGPRSMPGTRTAVAARPAEAALGRATRGLVGPSRATGATRSLPFAGRRLPRITRIVTPGRAAGLLGMLASGFLFTLATGPTAFALAGTEIPELRWTDSADVRDALALPDGANAFRLDTAPLEAALATLPAVAAADVSVALPDAVVVVRIEERRPVLAWQVGDERFLADADGVIFAIVDRSAPLPAGVAVVDDRRQGAITLLGIGEHLDPVDLDVATRLGSLTPTDVGSTATALRVAATDADGFVVTTRGRLDRRLRLLQPGHALD